MIEAKEFQGRSTAEAAIAASEALGVTRNQIDFKVISETGEGFDRVVVIKAKVKEGIDPSSNESNGNTREDRGERSDRSRGGRDRGERSERGRGGRDRDRGGRDRDRGGRGGRQEESVDEMLELQPVPAEGIELKPEIETPGERAVVAKEVLAKILELAGMEVETRLTEDSDEQIQVEVAGSGSEKVIGDRGETLLALQFVVNRIVARKLEGEQLIILDAAGYRERRRDALVRLAERLASKAEKDQKVVKLSPMSPHDRRVFHRALTDNEGVRTESKGEGLYRNLFIIPSDYVSASH
jgi:spoIIIJ-associated protein